MVRRTDLEHLLLVGSCSYFLPRMCSDFYSIMFVPNGAFTTDHTFIIRKQRIPYHDRYGNNRNVIPWTIPLERQPGYYGNIVVKLAVIPTLI